MNTNQHPCLNILDFAQPPSIFYCKHFLEEHAVGRVFGLTRTRSCPCAPPIPTILVSVDAPERGAGPQQIMAQVCPTPVDVAPPPHSFILGDGRALHDR